MEGGGGGAAVAGGGGGAGDTAADVAQVRKLRDKIYHGWANDSMRNSKGFLFSEV